MILWIQTYLSSIAAVAILIAMVSAIVIKLIKDKKAGRSSCGCNCASCGAGCACGKNK